MGKNGFLSVGKIIGASGLKGAIKVYPYVESLSVFKPDNSILVRDVKGREKTYTVKWVKPHGRVILLFLKEVTGCSLAEMLIGSKIFIEKAKFPKPEDGTYYWFDIIGLSVFTIDKRYIGRVESIIQTGSNDVYVVKDVDKETLIPALDSVVLAIDLKQKTMRVDLPEGL